MSDILPDVRPRAPTGMVMGPLGWMVPITCASCHADAGFVPQENMTFAFYLCDPCAAKYGEIAGTCMVPDEVFWRKCLDEMQEKYGRILTEVELKAVADANSSPLATLLREGR